MREKINKKTLIIMTKSLKQIQKENRKLILQAIHGTSYDEALKKEIGLGCDIVVQNYVCGVKDKTEIITLDKSIRICDLTGLFVFANNNKPLEIIEIIGKPITLNRVLLAAIKSYNEIRYFVLDNWDLTSETLEEQSEETQREINVLLTII